MTDIMSWFNETHREVRQKQIAAGAARSAVLRRHFDAPIEDVWDACTQPDRLNRWFLPVSGDLRPGGKFDLQGNAHGEILRCEPPRLLSVSWLYGDHPPAEVELRLTPGDDGDSTTLELEHASVEDVILNDDEQGLWGVGAGWELPLVFGLSKYLRGELPDAPAAEWYEPTPEDEEVAAKVGAAWAEVARQTRP